MKSIPVAFLITALGLAGACKTPDGQIVTGHEIDLVASDIAQAQFADLPVPSTFEILERSFGSQVGTFRKGILSYEGEWSPKQVQEYLGARLPEHGWELTSQNWESASVLTLAYRKGNTTANYKVWRDPAKHSARQGYDAAPGASMFVTKMQIEVDTRGTS